jgi:hypothetical protein
MTILTAKLTPKSDSSPVKVKVLRKRLTFGIYYKVKDHAFRRALETEIRELMISSAWDTERDIVILKEVRYEADFKKAWTDINTEARAKNAEVVRGLLFLHASKPTGENSGFEFAPATTGADATLKKDEMSALTKLPWAVQAMLDLRGCNTGMAGERRPWSVAEVMAKSQGVTTTGQMGYSYFSTSKTQYEEASPNSGLIYLWAFRRKKNEFLGDGKAIPAKEFRP